MSRSAKANELYFLTLTVVNWIDIFIRRQYKDLLVRNLQYCQQHKGLEIYAYVIMTNHLHLIAASDKFPVSDILRDFKTFTSKQLYRAIADNPQESRKGWMLKEFDKAGRANPLNKDFQVWQNGNYPIELYNNEVIDQKVDYIHENPVRAGIVNDASEYIYSSAHPLSPIKVLDM